MSLDNIGVEETQLLTFKVIQNFPKQDLDEKRALSLSEVFPESNHEMLYVQEV